MLQTNKHVHEKLGLGLMTGSGGASTIVKQAKLESSAMLGALLEYPRKLRLINEERIKVKHLLLSSTKLLIPLSLS